MIDSPGAIFTQEEAKRQGAMPRWAFTIFPYLFQTGIAAGSGTFTNCTFYPVSEIKVNAGASSASWVGPDMEAMLEAFPANAMVAWTEQAGGCTLLVEYRTASTLAALAGASWTAITNGDTYSFLQYYTLRLTWTGFRVYALPIEDDNDQTAMWAEPSPGDQYESYATPGESGESYIEKMQLGAEFPINPNRVAASGALTQEAPLDFSDLVAGSHSLTLYDPVGEFDPNSPNFVFAGESLWYGKSVRVKFGWQRPGTTIIDLITLYEGQILNWRTYPPDPSNFKVPTAEILSQDLVSMMLMSPASPPNLDGSVNPLVAGTVMVEAKQLADSNPFDPVLAADFETGDLSQVPTETGTNGTVAISSDDPGRGAYSMRCTITSQANSKALARLSLPAISTTIFGQGRFKVRSMPGTPEADSAILSAIFDNAGNDLITLQVDNNSKLYVNVSGGSPQASSAYLTGNPGWNLLTWGLVAGNPCYFKVWLNGEEIISVTDQNYNLSPFGIWFGIKTGAASESWTIDWDDVEVWNIWQPAMFQVPGGPYQSVEGVYTDGVLTPVLQVKKTKRQLKLEKRLKIKVTKSKKAINTNYVDYPEYGAIAWVDYANPPSGTVMLQLIKDEMSHPVDALQQFLTGWGYGAYIDADYFAAAKAATPEYSLGNGYYFDGDAQAKGDVLKEICSRFLLSFWQEQGMLRLKAFINQALASPALTLTPAMRKSRPSENDLTQLVPQITAKCGWADRNPDLNYQASDAALLELLGASSNSDDIDLSWGQPVMSDNFDTAKLLADRLLARLKAHRETIDASGWLDLIRAELGDVVSLNSILYEIYRKEVNAAFGSAGQQTGLPGVTLGLARFAGVS